MSRDSCITEVGGLKFKVTGTVMPYDRPPCEDMEVIAIFSDEDEQVQVELSDEFLDELYIHEGMFYSTLREKFERDLVREALGRQNDV